MKFTNTDVFNFEGAIRGARNPLESWDKSDSTYCCYLQCKDCPLTDEQCDNTPTDFVIGNDDMDLLQRLVSAGSDHAKFMRQIMVSVDITAPLYYFKELGQYKVGVTSNSTSTMHKLATTPITRECFEVDDTVNDAVVLHDFDTFAYTADDVMDELIKDLEQLRQRYLETNDKAYWKALIMILPSSWLQTRTITMNYQNLRNMYFQRRTHKLTEWSVDFMDWIDTLPYADELIKYEKEK